MADQRFKRFQALESEESLLNGSARVIVDARTGVHYLVYSYGQGTGITPLLDENGRVVIDKGDVK